MKQNLERFSINFINKMMQLKFCFKLRILEHNRLTSEELFSKD